MNVTDRIAAVVRTMDWVAGTLSEDGIHCSDLTHAADELNAIKLEMERPALVRVSNTFQIQAAQTAGGLAK